MRRRVIAATLAVTVLSGALQAQPGSEVDSADWPRYARDMGGTRYSPLDDINTANVGDLQEAWSFRLRPNGGAALLGGSVPIVIDGIMYLPLGNAIVSLEAHTGRELWRHDVSSGLVRRGVSYWPGEGDAGARIFYSTGNGLVALQAATGEVDTAFGDGGSIEFDGAPYPYPPSIYGNVMVIGANTPEISKGPAGDSRAFDARTGELLWRFRTVPGPGEVGHETWLDDGWKERPGANMWIWYTTADPDNNLLYMTLGSPGPN